MKLKTINTIANVLSIIGIIGIILSDKTTIEGRTAFFISLGFLIIGLGLDIYIWSKKGWKWGFKWNPSKDL